MEIKIKKISDLAQIPKHGSDAAASDTGTGKRCCPYGQSFLLAYPYPNTPHRKNQQSFA